MPAAAVPPLIVRRADGEAGPDLDWLRTAVVYQIFVDRFANGDRRLDPPNVAPWGTPPTATTFMGGDLRGIADRLGYLDDLGINVIYLTPIFMAASSHRYDTYDYERLDPRVGSLRDLRRLLRACHRRGIRVLLDGVFNHCGRGFFPFFDVMENGERSAWRHWFHVEGFPVQAYGAHRYRACLGAGALPEFDLDHPPAREYLTRVAQFWTRQGIDGWRLDAVPHVGPHGFWGDLRRAVRAVNPSAYLVAEIWGDPSPWLASGDFDGATDYRFRDLALRFLIERAIHAREFSRGLEALLAQPSARPAGSWNLIGSHDTPRIRTLARDVADVKLAFLLQFTFPGVPAVYYGDEIGLAGAADPDNRRAMEWDEGRRDRDLHAFVRRLAAIRGSTKALQDGDWRTVLADDRRDLCVFARRSGADPALVVLHPGEGEASLSLDLAALDLPAVLPFVDHLGGRRFAVEGGVLRLDRLPPRGGLLLTPVDRH